MLNDFPQVELDRLEGRISSFPFREAFPPNFLSITSLVRSNSLKSVGEPVSSAGHATIFWQHIIPKFLPPGGLTSFNSVTWLQYRAYHLKASSPAQKFVQEHF